MFHLQRILDRQLLVLAKCQCRPKARILERPAGVGIERYLHLDHAFDAVMRPVGAAKSLRQIRQQCLVVEFRRFAAGADKAVGGAADKLGHDGAVGADENGHRGFRPIVDRGVFRLVELPGKRHALFAPKLPHQLDRLLQAAEAYLELGPDHAGRRHLVERFAAADAKHDPSGIKASERREGLGNDRRVIAKCRRQHAGAERHAGGPRPERAQPGERERRVAAGVAPRLKVVADENRVEADLLGEATELQKVARTELLRRCFVAQFDHCVL